VADSEQEEEDDEEEQSEEEDDDDAGDVYDEEDDQSDDYSNEDEDEGSEDESSSNLFKSGISKTTSDNNLIQSKQGSVAIQIKEESLETPSVSKQQRQGGGRGGGTK